MQMILYKIMCSYCSLFLFFISGKGYDTLVGERGGLLSGGQRQVQ